MAIILLVITLLAVAVSASAASFTIPFKFPLFKQCDQPWANDIMDTKTICSVGCLMTSTVMGLAGSNIPIEGQNGDPRALNTWLKANGGYDGSNDLIESVVPKIDPTRIAWPADAMHRTNDLTYATVVDYLNQGRIVVANVMNGGHFVLITGYSTDNDSFAVNDSGFNTTQYSYSKDVVGYRIYDMIRE